MQTKSLYDIQVEHASLIQYLLDLEGELTPEMEEQLTINEDELTVKAEGYALRILEFNGQAGLIKNEIARLTAKKKKYEDTAEQLKDRIEKAMKQFNRDKIETTRVKLSFRKSSAVQLPENFTEDVLKYVKLEAKLDTEKIEAVTEEYTAKEADLPFLPTESMLEYFKVSASVDSAKIKADLKDGVTIATCTIVDNQNLQIK